jgi:hypothetical protein
VLLAMSLTLLGIALAALCLMYGVAFILLVTLPSRWAGRGRRGAVGRAGAGPACTAHRKMG